MTPVVRSLLIANVGVYFLQITMPVLLDLFVFVPQLALVRPWSIVTYMFLHDGLMHLGFNMLVLFFFGPRVESRIGSRPFTILYFIAGITGALLSFIFSFNAAIVGASAGVYGVMLAFAYFWPDERILIWGIIPVPARILVLITTAFSLFSGFGGAGGNIAHFAHLGGYLGAYLYLKWIERKRTAFKRKAAAAPAAVTKRVQDYKSVDRTQVHEVNRDEVDRILDKINETGISSLTPQERVFLANFVPLDDRMPPVS